MRDIWAIVVGVVLLGGAGITVYEATKGPDPRERQAAPARAAAAETVAQVAAPRMETRFEAVEISAEDYVLGKADAPVTIVEYASFTCPHCAQLATATMPTVKKELIDTGKARLVYRDFPLDRLALTASLVARCAPRERYFGFVDVLFAGQANWARATDPIRALGQIAQQGGIAPDRFDSCIKDEAATQKVLQQRIDGEQKFGVKSTPTLLINGARYSGALTYDQIKAIVEPFLPKG
jgi:protein-disulfide isomerase